MLAPLGGPLLLSAKPGGTISAELGGQCPRSNVSSLSCPLSLRFVSLPSTGQLAIPMQGKIAHVPPGQVRLGVLYPLQDGVLRIDYRAPSTDLLCGIMDGQENFGLPFEAFGYTIVNAIGTESLPQTAQVLLQRNNAPIPGDAYAMVLDGDTSWVELSELNQISGDATIELWIDAKSVAKGQNLVGKHSKKGSNIFLFGFFNGRYMVRVKKKTVMSKMEPQLRNMPQHLAAVVEQLNKSSSHVIIYLNAEVIASGTIDQVPRTKSVLRNKKHEY